VVRKPALHLELEIVYLRARLFRLQMEAALLNGVRPWRPSMLHEVSTGWEVSPTGLRLARQHLLLEVYRNAASVGYMMKNACLCPMGNA